MSSVLLLLGHGEQRNSAERIATSVIDYPAVYPSQQNIHVATPPGESGAGLRPAPSLSGGVQANRCRLTEMLQNSPFSAFYPKILPAVAQTKGLRYGPGRPWPAGYSGALPTFAGLPAKPGRAEIA